MKQEPIKFEVGKWYQTRDGRKVRCAATDGDSRWPILCVNPGHAYLSLTANGRDYNSTESKNDIIGPWIDKPVVDWATMPAWAEWVAMEPNGHWYCYTDAPSIVGGSWHPPGISYWCKIPPNYAPTFAGDWKDSLTQRTA